MPQHTVLHPTLAKVLARTQALLGLSLLLALGGLDFFYPSAYSVQAGVHGTSAIGAMIMGTFMTHRAYPLIRGVHVNMESLRDMLMLSTALNFTALISGNWIYMRYRGTDGPRDWILQHVANFHNVLMEFKEFISIFPFPLMLAATFITFYYRDHLEERRDITQFTGILILLSWLFLLGGFVAGLTLAKLRFV
ncbi:MAG: hypothetical protein RIQ52_1822 [Pseudomonadota bacterium]|jgi:uncharacterized membrane protein